MRRHRWMMTFTFTNRCIEAQRVSPQPPTSSLGKKTKINAWPRSRPRPAQLGTIILYMAGKKDERGRKNKISFPSVSHFPLPSSHLDPKTKAKMERQNHNFCFFVATRWSHCCQHQLVPRHVTWFSSSRTTLLNGANGTGVHISVAKIDLNQLSRKSIPLVSNSCCST